MAINSPKKTYSPNEQLPASVAGPIQQSIAKIQQGISSLGGSATSVAPAVNPRDLPGYVPGSLPGDRPSGGKPIPQTPNVSVATPELQPTDQAPQELANQVAQAQQGVSQLATSKGLTLKQNATGGYTAIPDESALRKQAHQALTQSGEPASQSAGVGGAVTQSALGSFAPQKESPSILGPIQETDSMFDSLFTQYDEFFSPTTQRESLLSEYEKLSGSLGIETLNKELIDTKRIIDGTEDDIRSEITSAGGTATESQVMAMSNSRNKQLIKNYNYLLDTKNASTTQLTTMMNLSVQDHEFANGEFDRKLGFATKVMEFKQKATDNARQTYLSLGDKMGWDTLLTTASPYEKGIIQKTLGVSSQALSQLATASAQQRALKGKETTMDNAIKAQQLYNLQLTGRKQEKELGIGVPTTTLSLSKAHGDIQQIDELTKASGMASAVGTTALTRTGAGRLGTAGAGALAGAGIGSFFGPIGTLVGGVVGLAGGLYAGAPSQLTGSRQDFIAGVEQLRSQLNLDTLVQAKAEGATFGALSDNELRVLANAATKLGSYAIVDDGITIGYNINERGFRNELDKINYYAKLDYILKGGAPEDVGAIVQPDNTVWIKDSFGNLKQLQ